MERTERKKWGAKVGWVKVLGVEEGSGEEEEESTRGVWQRRERGRSVSFGVSLSPDRPRYRIGKVYLLTLGKVPSFLSMKERGEDWEIGRREREESEVEEEDGSWVGRAIVEGRALRTERVEEQRDMAIQWAGFVVSSVEGGGGPELEREEREGREGRKR